MVLHVDRDDVIQRLSQLGGVPGAATGAATGAARQAFDIVAHHRKGMIYPPNRSKPIRGQSRAVSIPPRIVVAMVATLFHRAFSCAAYVIVGSYPLSLLGELTRALYPNSCDNTQVDQLVANQVDRMAAV